MRPDKTSNRRKFIKGSAIATAGLATSPLSVFGGHVSPRSDADSICNIGPQVGYSPLVGTLFSTMTMMRAWVIDTVKELTVEQLDYQIDDQSNSIGAMLLHLAATERYFQLNTFDEMEWGTWNDDIKN